MCVYIYTVIIMVVIVCCCFKALLINYRVK